MRAIFICLVMVTMVYSCSNDNACEEIIEGDNLRLSDTIRQKISNYLDANVIIFEDSDNNEAIFTVSDTRQTNDTYQFSKECSEDPSQFQTVKGTSELLEIDLANNTHLNDTLVITLLKLVNTNFENASESLIVTSSEVFSNLLEQDDVLYSFDRLEEHVLFSDSLILRGKTFYSVYEPINFSWFPKYDIKYTLQEGIIYIADEDNGLELVYKEKI